MQTGVEIHHRLVVPEEERPLFFECTLWISDADVELESATALVVFHVMRMPGERERQSAHISTEMRRHSDSGALRHRDTETQRHRDTETQRHRDRQAVKDRNCFQAHSLRCD